MLTVIRALMALHAVAFFITSPAVIFVAATPFPIPIPLTATDFSRTGSFGDAIVVRSSILRATQANTTQAFAAPRALTPSEIHGRLAQDELTEYSRGLEEKRDYLYGCAHTPAQDSTRCIGAMKDFQDLAQGVYDHITGAPADKGLHFYNDHDTVQVVLRCLINAVKDVMSWVSKLADCLPILQPFLGAFVYQLKCIIDDLLNFVENSTDAVINALCPEVLDAKQGVDHYISQYCGAGFLGLGLGKIVGLCL